MIKNMASGALGFGKNIDSNKHPSLFFYSISDE
jgi:hypothetical protein